MGYLICENCGGYYELQEGESPDDFQNCECGGELKFIDYLEDYYNKKSPVDDSIESISKPKEEKKTSSKENANNQLKNNKEIITHYCPECGTKNSGIAVFCKECGKQLQTNKFVRIEKTKIIENPIKGDNNSYDNTLTIKTLNYFIIGILGILNLILSTNPHNNAYFLLSFPMLLILTVFLVYTLGDIKSLGKGGLIGFLVAIPFEVVSSINFIGSSFISSLLIYMMIFGLIGIVGGIIGIYLKRKKLNNIHKIDKFDKTIEINKSQRLKAGIVIIIFFVFLSIIGVVTASPIALMERTGDVDGLIDVLIYGNYAEQRDAMKALGEMDEVKSNYDASGVQASPYSNKIISILIDKIKNSPDYHVRADAAELTGNIWNGDENVVITLEDVNRSDNNQLVRMSANNALMMITMDKDTISFQKNLSMKN